MLLPTVFRSTIKSLPQPYARSPLFFWRQCLTPTSMVIPMPVRFATHKSAKAVKALKSLKKAESPQVSLPQSTEAPKPKTKSLPKPENKPRAQLPSTPKYYALEEILGSQEEPTLLYRKNHWKLSLVCYAATGLGLWCMYNYYQAHIVNPIGVGNAYWMKATYCTVIALIGVGVVGIFIYPWRCCNSVFSTNWVVTTDARLSLQID